MNSNRAYMHGYFFFFFFLRNKHTHTKGRWTSYITQHTLLSNVRQLPILFSFSFFEKQTHTHKREREGVLTQRHTATPLKSHINF